MPSSSRFPREYARNRLRKLATVIRSLSVVEENFVYIYRNYSGRIKSTIFLFAACELREYIRTILEGTYLQFDHEENEIGMYSHFLFSLLFPSWFNVFL